MTLHAKLRPFCELWPSPVSWCTLFLRTAGDNQHLMVLRKYHLTWETSISPYFLAIHLPSLSQISLVLPHVPLLSFYPYPSTQNPDLEGTSSLVPMIPFHSCLLSPIKSGVTSPESDLTLSVLFSENFPVERRQRGDWRVVPSWGNDSHRQSRGMPTRVENDIAMAAPSPGLLKLTVEKCCGG
ncbi:hypothetical protein CB1_000318006 [Camelus ferus]|nr:hypothetical protein CB1_000318006 [Camelus ferus]